MLKPIVEAAVSASTCALLFTAGWAWYYGWMALVFTSAEWTSATPILHLAVPDDGTAPPEGVPLRPAKSRAEELQQRLKQQLEGCIPGLWIMGLAVFSLGVGKAYNWKIGMCVLIILVTSFAVGYRRLTER